MGWIQIRIYPELLPGSGSRKTQSWIRIRNKSFQIHNTDLRAKQLLLVGKHLITGRKKKCCGSRSSQFAEQQIQILRFKWSIVDNNLDHSQQNLHKIISLKVTLQFFKARSESASGKNEYGYTFHSHAHPNPFLSHDLKK